MNEKEIFRSLKGLRFRIADEGEYRIDDKHAQEIAHKLHIEKEEQ